MHFKDLESIFVELRWTSQTKKVQPNIFGSIQTVALLLRENNKESDLEEQNDGFGSHKIPLLCLHE